jgi:nicotinamide mononucleotide (NMN) deamidase PncC
MSQRALTLHHSPWQAVLYVTGGGAGLLSELLTTPGASKTLLEAMVPYAAKSLEDLLGERPEQACSARTARALAMAAFQRSLNLDPGHRDKFGLGCSASLATDREKRGEHRAHVAIQTAQTTYNAEIALTGDRAAQEETLLAFMWHGLDQTLGLKLDLDTPISAGFDADATHALEHWRALILDEATAYATAKHDGKLLFPGAFNPLHHAHQRMLEIAEARLQQAGAFELSIVNVDKPLLDYTEIESRLAQFSAPVWLTRLPTFVEKARHFPEAHFIVGIDTLLRLVDPKYYGTGRDRDAAIDELLALGSRFIVFGREISSRKQGKGFMSLDQVTLPDSLRKRCIGISEAEFHEPISSTALRNATP